MTIRETLTETLPMWFANTQVGRKMVKDDADARQAKRTTNARELKDLRKRQERELPPMVEDVKTGAAAVKEAQAALREAEAAHGDAWRAKRSLSYTLDQQITQCEHALRETAPEAIDTFIEELQTELDRLRREPPFGYEASDGLVGPVPTHTSTPSVYRRIEGFQTAIQVANELKLEVLSDDAVRDRLTKLRAGIPEIKMEPIN